MTTRQSSEPRPVPDRTVGSRIASRRAVLAGAAGGAALLLERGGMRGRHVRAQPISPVGTPVATVPNYDDPTKWRGRTVRAGAWGGEVQDALRLVVLQSFAAATGCTVQEVITDYSQLASSQADGAPYADALVVDPIWAASALEQGLIEEIPADAIDRTSISPLPATEGAIPAYAYAMVSAFRRDAVLRIGEPFTWADWWNQDRYTGRRALPRGAFANFEFALMASGVSPDELYPLDSGRAIESLKEISGKIIDRWWDSGLQPVAWLSRSSTEFAAAWHYRVVAGKEDGRDIDFIWNQGLLIADQWVVPAGTANQDIALDLIRYATSPEAQAALARVIPLGPIAPAAFDALDLDVTRAVPTAPENLMQLVPFDANWWAANDVEANERFNSWLLGVDVHE